MGASTFNHPDNLYSSSAFIVQNGVITLSTTGDRLAVNSPNSIVATNATTGYTSVAGVSVYAFDVNATATVSVSLATTNGGLLEVTPEFSGITIVGNQSDSLMISGSLEQVNDALATLGYDDAKGKNDNIAIIADSAGLLPTAPASVAVVYDPNLPTVTISSAGGLVSSPAQTIQGTVGSLGAGMTVSIYDGSNLIGEATADSSGDWSARVALSQDGNNALTAQVTDSMNNTAVSVPVPFDWIETVADFVNSQSAIDEQSQTFALTDTAANVAGAFDTLNDDLHVASMSLTDTGTPVLDLTPAQQADDTTALAEITNSLFEVSTSAGATYYAHGTNVALAASNASVDLYPKSSLDLSGAGDAVTFLGAGDVAYISGGAETVNATNGKIYLTAAQAQATVIGGGDTIIDTFTPTTTTADDVAVTVTGTGTAADALSGAFGGGIEMDGAQATVSGANENIDFASGPNVVTLSGSGNAGDTVTLAQGVTGGVVNFAGAQATVDGGGVTINFQTGVDVVTLENTGRNGDTVNTATRGTVQFDGSAEATVIGGGNAIVSIAGSTINSVTLEATAGAADTLTGAFAAISLGGTLGAAQAVVNGGGENIVFEAVTSGANSVTLANTATVADRVTQATSADVGTIVLNNAQGVIVGEGYTVSFTGTSSFANLSGTDGVADTVRGSDGQVWLDAAQATVAGSSDTIDLTGASTATVSGSSDTINLTGTSAVTVSGGSDVIDVTEASAASVSASSAKINVEASTVTVSGSSDTIDVSGASTVTASGRADTINITGASPATVNASYATINVEGTGVVTVNGSSDTIIAAGGAVVLTGTGTAADALSGAFSSIEMEGAQATVSGANENIEFVSGTNSVTLSGGNGNANNTVTLEQGATGGVVNVASAQATVTIDFQTGVDGGAATLNFAEAQLLAGDGLTIVGATVSLSDTPTDIEAITPTEAAALLGAGYTSVAATGAVTLSLAEAQLLALDGLAITGATVSLSDTAANIEAITSTQAEALRGAGYTSVAAKGAVTLSLAEAELLGEDRLAITGAKVSLSDTAANIEAITSTEATALEAARFTSIAATGAVTLNLAQAELLAGDGLKIAGASVAISDTPINIEAITSSQAAALKAAGYTSIAATGGLTLGAAPFANLKTTGIKLTVPTGDTIVVSDTAANISSYLDALAASPPATIIVSDNQPLTISYGQIASDAAALAVTKDASGSAYTLNVSGVLSATDAATLETNSHVASFSVADIAANLLLKANAAGLVKASSVTLTGANTVTAAQAETLAKLKGFTVGADATLVVSDSAADLLNGANAGGIAKATGVTLTGANAVTAAQAAAFENANITLSAPVGDIVALSDTAADIAKLTTTHLSDLVAAGITTLNVTSGALTFSVAQMGVLPGGLAVTETGTATVTEDSATGYATYEKDERIAQKTLNGDGSYDIAHFEVSGLAYASYEDVFSKGGAKLAEQRDLKTGAGNLVLDTGGLTVSSSSGAFNVADATDTFALAAFIKQSITATGEKGETFDFGTGFGADTIAGFVAGKATGHDVLEFSASSGIADLATLLADTTQNKAGSAVITLDGSDSVTLTASAGKRCRLPPTPWISNSADRGASAF